MRSAILGERTVVHWRSHSAHTPSQHNFSNTRALSNVCPGGFVQGQEAALRSVRCEMLFPFRCSTFHTCFINICTLLYPFFYHTQPCFARAHALSPPLSRSLSLILFLNLFFAYWLFATVFSRSQRNLFIDRAPFSIFLCTRHLPYFACFVALCTGHTSSHLLAHSFHQARVIKWAMEKPADGGGGGEGRLKNLILFFGKKKKHGPWLHFLLAHPFFFSSTPHRHTN